MSPVPGEPDRGARYEIDPVRAKSVINAAAERALDLRGPIDDAAAGDAPRGVSPVVAGAFEGFLAERRTALRAVRDRAVSVSDAARQALAAYEAGDEEMAQATIAAAGAGTQPVPDGEP
ncbi:DUF6507 family protein [Myceligenerans indicum]|uniref:ESX-1 secretion-associated protein n=1 Tax=Myceligenerans indicum TaxID=2593663 RepID=A0ABS1LPH1_9MICO|nr:DUF6507 family protein [Myceligenerans indicum]MBL0888132.1 hypothetical protein [Myceligenerans indicum]